MVGSSQSSASSDFARKFCPPRNSETSTLARSIGSWRLRLGRSVLLLQSFSLLSKQTLTTADIATFTPAAKVLRASLPEAPRCRVPSCAARPATPSGVQCTHRLNMAIQNPAALQQPAQRPAATPPACQMACVPSPPLSAGSTDPASTPAKQAEPVYTQRTYPPPYHFYRELGIWRSEDSGS